MTGWHACGCGHYDYHRTGEHQRGCALYGGSRDVEAQAQRYVARVAVGLLLAALLLGALLAGCTSLPEVKPASDPWPEKPDGSPYARCFVVDGIRQTSCCATEGPIVWRGWLRVQTWITYSCAGDGVPGDCRGPEDNEPPPEAPRCADQGLDPKTWSDCWTCTGRSGGVWRYLPPAEEEPDVEPTPEPPAPTPTPGPPDPTPTPPPPEPAPEPTPEPTPPPELTCYEGPWLWVYAECRPRDQAEGICVAEEPPRDQLGAEVHVALRRARTRAVDEGIAVPISRSPHPPHEARAELVEPVHEGEVRYAAIAAEELRGLGLCAGSGPPNAREEVRVGRPGERTVEVWDVAIGPVIGAQERHMPTFGRPRAGDAEPGPTPEPVEETRTCTVRGIGDPGGGLKRFRSFESACSAILALLDRQGEGGGHSTRPVVIGGETWHLDQGDAGGCYDSRCDRYDQCGGTKVAGPSWLGIECSP